MTPLEVRNPATEAVIERLEAATEADADAAVEPAVVPDLALPEPGDHVGADLFEERAAVGKWGLAALVGGPRAVEVKMFGPAVVVGKLVV